MYISVLDLMIVYSFPFYKLVNFNSSNDKKTFDSEFIYTLRYKHKF